MHVNPRNVNREEAIVFAREPKADRFTVSDIDCKTLAGRTDETNK